MYLEILSICSWSVCFMLIINYNIKRRENTKILLSYF